MAKDKSGDDKQDEKQVQKTYRLPVSDLAFIDLLVKRQIIGTTATAVVRNLLRRAIDDLTEKEFVKKKLESIELLKKEK